MKQAATSYIMSALSPINWRTMENQPIPNEPKCGFRGDKLECLPKGELLLITLATMQR